jgi:LPLT family lysophospholipid transporter-like MFS transporter
VYATKGMNMRKPGRNYQLLLASQFLSAFGDNLLIMIILSALTAARADGKITEQAVSNANAIYSALFFLPFVLLAPLAGFLNDRHPKTTWLTGGNLIKLCGTSIGVIGLLLHQNIHGLSYLIVGIGACCYSPAKYGILPEIVPADRLVKANGTVEMLTLLAILGGLLAGGILMDHQPQTVGYLLVAATYGLSLLFNALMTRTGCNPQARLRSSFTEFGGNLQALLRHARLGRILLGCGLFWFLGASLRTNLQSWGMEVLKQINGEAPSNAQLALLKVWLALGIILGSVAAGQFHRTGDLRATRPYGWLMALFTFGLGMLGATGGRWTIQGLLILTGIAAGLFLIPLNASLQHESDQTRLGKTIASQNFVDYLAMLLGAGFVWLCTQANLTADAVFVALAVTIGLLVIILNPPPQRAATAPTQTSPSMPENVNQS